MNKQNPLQIPNVLSLPKKSEVSLIFKYVTFVFWIVKNKDVGFFLLYLKIHVKFTGCDHYYGN